MTKLTTIRGLKDRLREAETAAEIDALLTEGDGYTYADKATRGKWQRAAKQRKSELKEGKEC